MACEILEELIRYEAEIEELRSTNRELRLEIEGYKFVNEVHEMLGLSKADETVRLTEEIREIISNHVSKKES